MHPAVVLTSRPHANANNKLRIGHSSVKRQRTYVVLPEKRKPRAAADARAELHIRAAVDRHPDETSPDVRNRNLCRVEAPPTTPHGEDWETKLPPEEYCDEKRNSD